MRYYAAILGFLGWAGRLQAQGFVLPTGCRLSFDKFKTDGLDVDSSCTADGNAKDDLGKRLESNAKNNFCATGTPIAINYNTFTRLEDLSTDQIRRDIKTDRGALADLGKSPSGRTVGEGTMVRFVAYILDAHPSNVGKGELVNCNTKGADWNDIHIELVKSANEDDACNSIAAEMSPHFRPSAWSDLPALTIKRLRR